MTKRPLIVVVVSFILGLLVYLVHNTFLFVFVLLAASWFFALTYAEYKRTHKLILKARSRVILASIVAFVVGFFNISFRDNEQYLCNTYDQKHIEAAGYIYKIEDKLKEDETSYNIYIRIKQGEDCFNVIVYGEGTSYNVGDKICVSGKLQSFEKATNPGCFDMKKYYQSQNIYFSLSDSNISLYDRSDFTINPVTKCYLAYNNFLYHLKRKFKSQIARFADSKTASIYCGILLGDKAQIDDNVRNLYQSNGISHLLSISGLHVSMLTGILYFVMIKLGFGRNFVSVIALLFVYSYGVMTGFSMATLRAVVMITLSIIATFSGDNYDMLTGVFVADFVIFIYQPFRILDISVWLSSFAILGVCLGQYIIKNVKYLKYINSLRKRLLATLIVSFSINVVMLPVVVYTYHEVPIFSIFLNLIVIPLMTYVMISGIGALIFSVFDISLGTVLVFPGKMILSLYEKLCEGINLLPVSTINIGEIKLYHALIYYSGIVLIIIIYNKNINPKIRQRFYIKTRYWFDYKKWRRIFAAISFAIIALDLGFCYVTYRVRLGEQIEFIDVGQGDGILIRTSDGLKFVIDGGSISVKNIGKYTLEPCLKYNEMAHVNYWFISHTDTDHIQGLVDILEAGSLSGIKIDNLVLSKSIINSENANKDNLIKLAHDNKINIMGFGTNDEMCGDSFSLKCLHPDFDYQNENVNDMSLALEYISDKFDVYLMGDMSADSLSYMMETESLSAADTMDESTNVDGRGADDRNESTNVGRDEQQIRILKVPHHGSKYSICDEFYKNYSFDYAVISCGERNLYGHPHKESLDYIKKRGIQILRTDKNGGVVFK